MIEYFFIFLLNIMFDIAIFLLTAFPIIFTLLFSSWRTFLLCCSIVYFIYAILPRFFGLKYMCGADSCLSTESSLNTKYIQGALIIDRMTKEEATQLFITRGLGSHEKFQYRTVEILGRLFWKKEENMSESHLIFYDTPIKNMDGLYAFKEDLYTKSIPNHLSQWQVHFIEYFQDDKSVIVFKSHHNLCDGIALISLIVSTSDPNKTSDNYIRFHRKSLLLTLAYYLKSMILFPYLLFIIATRNEPIGPLHSKNLTGKKSISVTSEIPIENLKKFCRKENISINDYLLATIAKILQKYIANHSFKQKNITIIIPFSLRTLPEDNSVLPLENDVSFLFCSAPVDISDEGKRYKIFHDICEDLKFSSDPFANDISQKAIGNLLPKRLKDYFINDIGNRSSLFFTNVPGPKYEITFNGKRLHKIFFMSPAVGSIALSVGGFSYNGKLTVGITCDKGVIPESKILIEYLEEELALVI